MNLRDLFRPIHPNARPMNGLASRLFAALARPSRTSYTAPSLMTATAVLYAIRGYDVYWSPVRPYHHLDGRLVPSSLGYRVYSWCEELEERYPSHGVEPLCLFPDRLVIAEHRFRESLARGLARVTLLRRAIS
jgi:hypothetical protein